VKQFPPPTGLATFSDGMRSITKAELEDFGAETKADFYFIEDHIVTLAGEVKKTRLFDVTHDANYDSIDILFIEGGVIDRPVNSR